MAAEQVDLPQDAAAAPSSHQLDAVADNANAEQVENAGHEQEPAIQPNAVVEPPNRDPDGLERMQRLIIIHQRRNGEDENAANRNR